MPPRYRWTLRCWATRVAHAGNQRYCPCCDSHLRYFGPYGERPRDDALCPVCGALERHRLAAMYLQNRRDLLDRTDRILHVAPERPVERILRDWATGAYISVDLDEENAMMQADLRHMPFPSASFDGVFCSHVLEHVPEDRKAMVEMYRVLRPGGWALVQVPVERQTTYEDVTITDPNVRRQLFGQPDHVRVYGRDIVDRLTEAGFEVDVERPQQDLDGESVERCGLKTREEIFLCRKANA